MAKCQWQATGGPWQGESFTVDGTGGTQFEVADAEGVRHAYVCHWGKDGHAIADYVGPAKE